MNIFLTGGTGFIGSRLAVLLAARGHRLRCLVRNTSKARPLEALGATIVQGDITDDIALDHGLAGVDCAIHLAGNYNTGLVDRAAMERVNVDGTRAFLRFAEHHEVRHIVHVSTAYVLEPVEPGTTSPSDAACGGPHPTLYQRTKAAAHRLAVDARSRGLPVLIACPSFVYGPGDDGPAGIFIRELLRRRLPGLLSDPSWFSYVHVDDVAQGLLACGERGRPGALYVLGGEPASVNDFAARVCALAGVRPPPLRFPPALATVGARILDLAAKPLRFRTSFNCENVRGTAHHAWVHSWELAAADLSYEPRSLEQGLPETVAWFKSRAVR
jgi:nucleoside-diphosphate-sugar epimerase